jgi:hypothetical protein
MNEKDFWNNEARNHPTSDSNGRLAHFLKKFEITGSGVGIRCRL